MKRILMAFAGLFLFTGTVTAGTISITGTVRGPDGNAFNGRIRFTLSVSTATDTVSNNIVVAQRIEFPVRNGSLPTTAKITPNDILSPANTTYAAEYFTPAGVKVGQQNFYVAGSQFNMSTSTPTPITTSNISFDLTPFIPQPTARDCSKETGSTAGAKIRACMVTLQNLGGGFADTRAMIGPMAINQNLWTGITTPITLEFGCGASYSVTTTQTITSTYNQVMRGCSTGGDVSAGTVLQWNGANAGTVLFLDTVRDSEFSNFSIVPGSGSVAIGIRIDIVTPASGSFTSTHNKFRSIHIGSATTGVQIGNTSTSNNAEHTFYDLDCEGGGISTQCVYINNGQSKNIQFFSGLMSNAQYGIYQNGGSFRTYGLVMSGNSIASYHLTNPNDGIIISGGYDEGSARCLEMNAFTGVVFPVLYEGNTCQTNHVNADGNIIRFEAIGPLTLIGNSISNGGAQDTAKIYVHTADTTVGFTSIGNFYGNNTPFAGSTACHVSLSDNYVDTMTVYHPLPATNTCGITMSGPGTNFATDLSVNGFLTLTDTTQRGLGSDNGFFTPVTSAPANMTITMITGAGWMRVGNTVTMTGRFEASTATTTTASSTQFNMTLPFPLGASGIIAGFAISTDTAIITGPFLASGSGTGVRWQTNNGVMNGAQGFGYMLTYSLE